MKTFIVLFGMLIAIMSVHASQKLTPIPESEIAINEANFKKFFLPRYNDAVAKLWRKKKKITREMWKQIVLAPDYEGTSSLGDIDKKFKAQFAALFKEQYAITFGDQSLPETFVAFKEQDKAKRLERLAKRYGDSAYCVNAVCSFIGRHIANIAKVARPQ